MKTIEYAPIAAFLHRWPTYLTKEQLQELQDTGIDEKIQKFATLFPNGTEVTRELCMKHSDVFSFGCPGARLMPHCGWKAYWDKVLNAKKEYKMRMWGPSGSNLTLGALV